MRRRPLLAAIAMAGGLVVLALLGWPILANRLSRSLEDRLAQETGRPWRIAAIDLDLAPALVLRDLVSDDGDSRIAIRKVTLSGAPSLLAGGSGTVHVVGEGIDLRMPLASPSSRSRSPTSSSGAGAGIDVASVVLLGLRGTMSEDGGSVAVSAATFEAVVAIGGAGSAAPLALGFDAMDHRVRIEIEGPASRGGRPLHLAVDPAGGPGRTARLDAVLHRDGTTYRLDGIAGTLDGTRVSGTGRLALDGRPTIDADMRLDALAISVPDTPAPGPGALTIPVRADILPDPAWFAHVDLRARLTVPRLSLGPVRLDGAVVTATARQGAAEASLAASPVYDGSLKARYALAPSAAGPRHSVSLSLSGNRVRPLLSDLLDAGGIDGRATGRLDIQVTGSRPADLARTAMGFADVSIVDGRLDGIAIARWATGGLAAAAGLSAANDRNDDAMRFSLLGGSFSIAEGRAVTTDLQLRSSLIQATGTGTIDLTERSLDLTFQPTAVPQGGRRAVQGRGLAVPVRVAGPWENPSVSADMSGLLRDPAGALQSIQDLGAGLTGPDAGGLGSLLDGILPRSDRPAPRRR